MSNLKMEKVDILGREVHLPTNHGVHEVASSFIASNQTEKVLGAGASAMVSTFGADRVLKIFDKRDVGSLAYLKYCQENDGKYAWLPKVFFVKEMQNYNMAVIEILNPSYTCYSKEFNRSYFNTVAPYYAMGELLASVTKRKTMGYEISLSWMDFAMTSLNNDHYNFISDMTCIISAHDMIRVDMHCGNVMLRDNQFVVNDPFYFSTL